MFHTEEAAPFFVRLLMPNEAPRLPVNIAKLIINPSYNDEDAVLLNLASMTVSLVVEFRPGAAMYHLSSNQEPSQDDILMLRSLHYTKERVAAHMAFAYFWRNTLKDRKAPNIFDIVREH